ncbi:MAG TPA: multidrug transporter [Erythrobacter sp.]|nr:multidrug transporter [Erythrobacter sp.]
MNLKLLLAIPLTVGAATLAAWGILGIYEEVSPGEGAMSIPTTRVRKGDVTFGVAAKGELQGVKSEMLPAPMIGTSELVITDLREPGEIVQAGDVVVEFDTTEQTFTLREAQADLAEAQQHLVQARADSQAKEEEARYLLMKAETDLRIAELDARQNEMLAAIAARQNILAVEAARDRLSKLREDLTNRKASTEAGVAIQEAAVKKAEVQAETAQRNIDLMTLRTSAGGYVSIQGNRSSGSWGTHLPSFQVGDTARPGMAVAQIPDMNHLQVSARIGELDRGHLEIGQSSRITVAALPGESYSGTIQNIGGTTGPFWDRRFECKISLDDPTPELRPGMSVRLVITTSVVNDVLWLPSQALFESDGRKFVYLRSRDGFSRQDVELVRGSASQAVITGLEEGQLVAMADPTQFATQEGARGSLAMPKP